MISRRVFLGGHRFVYEEAILIPRGPRHDAAHHGLVPGILVHDNRVDWHYGYLATRVVAKKISATSLAWPVDPALVSRGNYPH